MSAPVMLRLTAECGIVEVRPLQGCACVVELCLKYAWQLMVLHPSVSEGLSGVLESDIHTAGPPHGLMAHG